MSQRVKPRFQLPTVPTNTGPPYRTKVKGMRQNAIDAINALEPYKGGAGETLWRLNRLNNIDKHRLLIPACSRLSAYSAPPSDREALRQRFLDSHPSDPAPVLAESFKEVTNFVPWKAGEKLLTVPYPELQPDMKFIVPVVFNVPNVAEGMPLEETLIEMSGSVLRIVLKFDPLLN